MAETLNYNLYKPQAGESGWAEALNSNLDIIDAQIKSNQDGLSNHAGIGTNKHSAAQIQMANGSSVETEIASILSGKADVNHSHNYTSPGHTHLSDEIMLPDEVDLGHHISRIDSEINAINNTLNLIAVDLETVEISAQISNRFNGIRLLNNTNPVINIATWIVEIQKDGITLCEIFSSTNQIFIDDDSLTNVDDGDTLIIIVTASTGISSKSKSYSHVYHETNNNILERLNAIETQLTIGNIIDAFAQDGDALQALANVLHSSNTLAQKIAELGQT